MNPIASESLKQLFTEARTYSSWLPKEISDQNLRDIYELMKWCPTSANLSPARIVFIRNGVQKDKLLPCLSPANVDKVKSAPVTAIIAQDEKFYDQTEKLFPHAPTYREMFASNQALAETTAFRNSSLQGAYFILAARALGFSCGAMSGFDNNKLDETFFAETSWRSNFICNIGYGNTDNLFPRLPRLDFEEACRII
ncbi:Nitroreductase family protein (plasmid) [Candidatus Trichorickettsia mobilis]|uniref:malonic semialdehyde reductase n=1 Tax=Candidatus Trichorickettsia mobilis TaxID=1346319 RepID=UPI002B25B2B0|nr:malonic semialdehyde reductase [Candidatus Trichorickettsia mobilis]WPY01572.1 Nitroreductase family protein [Candidatus Trichorickettsia mobilis]